MTGRPERVLGQRSVHDLMLGQGLLSPSSREFGANGHLMTETEDRERQAVDEAHAAGVPQEWPREAQDAG